MTEMVISIRPLLAVICPMIAAPGIFLLRRHANIRETVTLLAAVIQFAIIISMAPAIIKGSVLAFRII